MPAQRLRFEARPAPGRRRGSSRTGSRLRGLGQPAARADGPEPAAERLFGFPAGGSGGAGGSGLAGSGRFELVEVEDLAKRRQSRRAAGRTCCQRRSRARRGAAARSRGTRSSPASRCSRPPSRGASRPARTASPPEWRSSAFGLFGKSVERTRHGGNLAGPLHRLRRSGSSGRRPACPCRRSRRATCPPRCRSATSTCTNRPSGSVPKCSPCGTRRTRPAIAHASNSASFGSSTIGGLTAARKSFQAVRSPWSAEAAAAAGRAPIPARPMPSPSTHCSRCSRKKSSTSRVRQPASGARWLAEYGASRVVRVRVDPRGVEERFQPPGKDRPDFVRGALARSADRLGVVLRAGRASVSAGSRSAWRLRKVFQAADDDHRVRAARRQCRSGR